MMLKPSLRQPIVLHLFMLTLSTFGCGFFALYLGKELGWDLANYHFYAPFAYWHARYTIDYWPTSFIQQFLNPTLDFLSYFLITNFHPKQVEFFLGFLHGINIWLIFIIARLFFPYKILLPLLLAVLGMYGPTVFPGIGSFQQDNLVSLFVLSFVFLQLGLCQRSDWSGYKNNLLFAVSYLLLGLGTGLKLTCGIYFIGGMSAFIFIMGQTPSCALSQTEGRSFWITLGSRISFISKRLFFASSSFAIGILITSGYWMAFMWQNYGNPVFPFLNNIFKSPYFFLQNWQDIRFMPKNIWQHLFYPFFFSWDGRIGDAPFQDFRFLIIYLLLAAFLLMKLMQRVSMTSAASHQTKPLPIITQWLVVFFVTSYIVWQWYFSIARYLMALEMLAPLFIFLLIQHLCVSKTLQKTVMALCFYTLTCLYIPHQMVRTSDYNTSFFNIRLPKTIQRSHIGTVLVAFPAYTLDLNPRPQSYLLPFFPKGYQFIGVPILHGKYLQETRSHETILKKLKTSNRPIYLLTVTKNMPELRRTARLFGLKPAGACEQVLSDRQALTDQLVWLCPVG